MDEIHVPLRVVAADDYKYFEMEHLVICKYLSLRVNMCLYMCLYR